MYNDKLVYKVVIWVFYGIGLWKEKEALTSSIIVFIAVYLYVFDIFAILYNVIMHSQTQHFFTQYIE